MALWTWARSPIYEPPCDPSKYNAPKVHDITTYIVLCVSTLTSLISAIGTISSIILSWRSDRRDAREKELRIAQLERELEAAKRERQLEAVEAIKDTPVIPIPKKTGKKVR
jgi:hypothetical protein